MSYPDKDKLNVTITVPKVWRDAVKKLAAESRRSFTQQVVYLAEKGMEAEKK